jgi:DnaJ-class molecular chaperone
MSDDLPPLTEIEKLKARLARLEELAGYAECTMCDGTGIYQGFNAWKPNRCEFCEGNGTWRLDP